MHISKLTWCKINPDLLDWQSPDKFEVLTSLFVYGMDLWPPGSPTQDVMNHMLHVQPCMYILILHSRLFSRGKFSQGRKFSRVELFPAFQGKNFHELSWIVRSTYWKVNISRVKFSWIVFDLWNLQKNFPLENNLLYGTLWWLVYLYCYINVDKISRINYAFILFT